MVLDQIEHLQQNDIKKYSDEAYWKDHDINEMFQIKKQSFITVDPLNYKTKPETEKQMNLMIPFNDKDDLLTAIKRTVKDEDLKGANQYEHPKAGKVDAVKKNKFSKLPPYLLIQLLRFEYCPQDQCFKKNRKELSIVNYSTLDLSEMMDDDES